MRSISRSLGTKDYLRVRVGIGRPPGRQDPADFVLKDFSSVERKELPILLEDAADAAEQARHRGAAGHPAAVARPALNRSGARSVMPCSSASPCVSRA
nr:aminoacyl-tRNA hydrolase [Angustibacter aerolatus]